MKDIRAKVAFRQQTRLGQLKPNYGRWRWHPQRPKPSWTALQTAPVWRDPAYASLRASLAQAPAAVQAAATGDSSIEQLLLQSPSEPDRSITLTMYVAGTDSVPAGIASNVPRAAIVLLDGTDFVAPQIKAHMDDIPVMLFGDGATVKRMQLILAQFYPSRLVHLIWAYIKPKQPIFDSLSRFHERGILLMGDRNCLNFQVCWSSPPAQWSLEGIPLGWHWFPMVLCAVSHNLFYARPRIKMVQGVLPCMSVLPPQCVNYLSWDEESYGSPGYLLHVAAVHWFLEKMVLLPTRDQANLLLLQDDWMEFAANLAGWLPVPPNFIHLYTGHHPLAELKSRAELAFQAPPPVQLDRPMIQRLSDGVQDSVPFWQLLDQPRVEQQRLHLERRL